MERDVLEGEDGLEGLELIRELEDSIPDRLPQVRRGAGLQQEERPDGRDPDSAVAVAGQNEQPAHDFRPPAGWNHRPKSRQRLGRALPDVGVAIGNHGQ